MPVLLPMVLALALNQAWTPAAAAGRDRGAPERYLAAVQDRFHDSLDVYTSLGSAGNHFPVRARIGSLPDSVSPPMNEAYCEPDGNECIHVSFGPVERGWGGWCFLNGVLGDGTTLPQPNWGTVGNAGLDLGTRRSLSFRIKGLGGVGAVRFFCMGIGRDEAGVPVQPFPDSSKVMSRFLPLERHWRRYSLELDRADYVLGGFGWVADAAVTGGRRVEFLIDDINYDLARPQEPRFLVSYETRCSSGSEFDLVMRNVAFTYDNALAVLAFLAVGDTARASHIGRAFLQVQAHDRFYDDGRLRNAYQGGDVLLPAGWIVNGRSHTARLPGFWSGGSWREDSVQVSTHTGNVAWAMIALLALYEACPRAGYLDAAERMGDWIERHCRAEDALGGYIGGYGGWEPSPQRLTYKATEHNIDCAVAFERLWRRTGAEAWKERSIHAKRFVDAMWDSEEGRFWTGTEWDGVTINRRVIPLDVQAWAIQAFPAEAERWRRGLDYVERTMRRGEGYAFCDQGDGLWFEGTAQMALSYSLLGLDDRFRALQELLSRSFDHAGGIPAADRDSTTTCFGWMYPHRLHVGATAWALLALHGVNPFWE